MKNKTYRFAAVAAVLLALLVFVAPVSADAPQWDTYYASSWEDLYTNISTINELVTTTDNYSAIWIVEDITHQFNSDSQRIEIYDDAYVVLLLDGHTINLEWNSTGDTSNPAIFKVGNTTTSAEDTKAGAVLEVWDGTISLTNGTALGTGGTSSLFWVKTNSTLFIENTSATAPAFVASGNGDWEGTSYPKYPNAGIIVEDAVLRSTSDVAIYMAAPGGFVEINDDADVAKETKISGSWGGIDIRAGELLMLGGTVEGTGSYVESPTPTTGSSTNTGSGISLSWDSAYKKPIILDLIGGTVKSTNGHAIINLMADGEESEGYALINIDQDFTLTSASGKNDIVSVADASSIQILECDYTVDETDEEGIFTYNPNVQNVLFYPGVNQSLYDAESETVYDYVVWTGSASEGYTLTVLGDSDLAEGEHIPYKLMSGFTAKAVDKAINLSGDNILFDGNGKTINFKSGTVSADIAQPFYIEGNNVIVDNVKVDASSVSSSNHLWTVGVEGQAVNITKSEIKAGTATGYGSFAINIGLWSESTGATFSENTLTMGAVTPAYALGNEVSTAVYAYGGSYAGLTISSGNTISGTDVDTLNAALTIGGMDSSAVVMTQNAPITISGNTITLKEGTIAGLNTSALVFSTAANAGNGQYWINTGSNTLSGVQLFFVGYSMKTDSLPKSTVNGTESQGGLSGIAGLEKPTDAVTVTLMGQSLPLDVSTLADGTKYRMLDINVNGSVTQSQLTGMGVNVTLPTDNLVYYQAPVSPPASTPTYTPSTSTTTKPTEPETPVEPETPTEPVAGEVTVETEVTNGGEVSFETPVAEGSAPVADTPVEINAVVLPEGTTGEVSFIPVSEKPAPVGKETQTKKVFEINVPTYEKGKAAVVKFTMTVAELTADGKTAADVALWHFDEETGEWTKLVTSFTIVDGIVYFEAITYDFSPFAIIYEDAPAEEPTEEPTEEPSTPAPLFAVLAGLGAAVILRRK